MFQILSFVSDAYAMAPAPQGGQQAGGIEGMIASFLPLILIFVIFYFLLIRPQQKKAKEHKQMLDSLKKGDKIVTAGGLYGLIEAVSDNTVTIKIAENVKVKVGRGFISTVRAASEEE